MTCGSPFTVPPDERREAERLAADGLLLHLLRDVFVAADVPSDRSLREAALLLTVPVRLQTADAVVFGPAAAWLWGGGPAPGLVDVSCSGPGARRVLRSGLVVHDLRFSPSDVVPLGLAGVTGPARTAADLLRCCREPSAPGWEQLRLLVSATGVTRSAVSACLERMPRIRGVTTARRLLAQLPEPGGDQSIRLPVTRYASNTPSTRRTEAIT